MKNLINLLLIIFPVLLSAQDNALKLWYKQPASKWTEALPLGNGRLGAMVHGRYDHELFQMNEESVWAGSQINNNNKESAIHLKEIQDAIFKSQFNEAKELATKYMVGTPPRIRSYQPLGNIKINYSFIENDIKDYSRSLNLNQGVHVTSFLNKSNKIVQRSFISAPDDALFLSWTSDEPISFEITLDRARDVNSYGSWKDGIYYVGQILDSIKADSGPAGSHMRFAAGVKILKSDGAYEIVKSADGNSIKFKNVKNLLIAYSGNTDYNVSLLNIDPAIDPLNVLNNHLLSLHRSANKDFLAIHSKEHSSMFERVGISLNNGNSNSLATDQRLKEFSKGTEDFGLPVLFYQYGRYLLMSSSRAPGKLPANLQGIWNQDYEAPWNSDFHTNINLQMNYWPAETGDLGETSVVLANFMKEITKPGTQTAKEMYGAKGWTIHHLTDPFGRTGVADGVWGVSPMAGPWMTFPIFRHYTFSKDEQYLREIAYPIIKGSLLWVLDFLVESPEGFLVTNPSHSPENEFETVVNGKTVKSQLSYASTIDIQIIHELFDNFEQAAMVLDTDKDLITRVEQVRKQLPPIRIGKSGAIQEWIHDYKEVEPGHRHMSHLLGLYPGNSINPNTADLFSAAKKTIEKRLSAGGGHTGWSKAWIVNFYARLFDGESANAHLKELIGKTCLPNLFSTHPPFQIDGNFGGAAGLAEMLVQSQNAEIILLPAIPKSWVSGSVSGIKARGNYKLSFKWENLQVTSFSIQSESSGKIKVKFADKVKEYQLKKGTNHLTI